MAGSPPVMGTQSMFYSMASVYLLIKFIFFYGLVRAQVKSESLREHWFFLGVVYVIGVAFLSYVFLVSWQAFPWPDWQRRLAARVGISPWLCWLAQTFVLVVLYFRLLERFDEGVLFWTLILLGLLLVWF
jgi:hypothetical protein